jgi:cold shock CspA family protein
VANFLPDGYGFIIPDDGDKDIFFHSDRCVGAVLAGDRVRYCLKPNRGRKPAAARVEKIT